MDVRYGPTFMRPWTLLRICIIRFCKYILSVNMVNKSTFTNMVLGELGVTPLLLDAQCRMMMLVVGKPV